MPKAIDIASLLFLTVFASLVISLNVSAATTDSVTATVTAEFISVTVTDGTVAYGSLGTSATQDTTSGGLDDSQTATNGSNVTADFDISGQDSADWTLASSAGSDQYFHKFCTSNCDASPTWTALTTSYQSLATSVSASGTQIFDLQIGTPSTNTSSDQQSVDVTVLASAS